MSVFYGRALTAGGGGTGGNTHLKFTYTGDHVEREDGVVELRSSGTITFPKEQKIDIFCVGGGGKGGSGGQTDLSNAYAIMGGGGGGYTSTLRGANVQGSYQITIGNGSQSYNADGGTTSFGSLVSAAGGKSGGYFTSNGTSKGLAGGSGGGAGVKSNADFGEGGSDGNNGEHGYPTDKAGGAGQNTTTREFGEPTGKLYAGGGGGGRAMYNSVPIISAGGSGGGGSGAFGWYGNNLVQAAGAGGANTGGGGGGGVGLAGQSHTATSGPGGNGGSGIVCFRASAE